MHSSAIHDDIAGYDLVFINFNDGVDAIERNAAVVTEAILRINTNKVFDTRSNRREQNVVLGMGTGGLNARYALAQYTKANATNQNPNPTETRLLITHDAPHRGANIALGLQHLSRMLGSFSYFGVTSATIFPEFAETIAFFNTPVNQQTLIYMATSDINNTPNTFINTVYQPMVNYNAPYLFVPTSLGNECANHLFAAGRKFMDFEQGVATGLKVKLGLYGINLISIPLIDLKYDCAIFAASIPPQGFSSRDIARLKTEFKFLLFGSIQISKIGYNLAATASTAYLPIDGVPGSFNTILDFKELRNYSTGVGNFYFSGDQLIFTQKIAIKFVVITLKYYMFVKAFQNNSGIFTTQYTALPVGSALDVDPFNSSTFTEKYVNGVNQNFPSKGNTFIAQESNTSLSLFNNVSMRFTARNARFLYNEMEQLPNLENCSVECSNPYYISGKSLICSIEPYSIPGLPRGATITWQATPQGIVTINPPDAPQTTLTKISNGIITLTAVLTNVCGGQTITINKPEIVVGTSQITGIYYNPNLSSGILQSGQSVCAGTIRVQIDEVPGTTYTWQRIFGSAAYIDNGGYIDITLSQNENVSFLVTATSSCGSIERTLNFVADSPECGSGGGFLIFSVSPNPVKENMNINFDKSVKADKNVTVKLYAFNSTILIKQWILKGGQKQYSLNTSGIKNGQYVLELVIDNHKKSTQVIIE